MDISRDIYVKLCYTVNYVIHVNVQNSESLQFVIYCFAYIYIYILLYMSIYFLYRYFKPIRNLNSFIC